MMRECEVGFRGKALIGDELRRVTLISDGELLRIKDPTAPCPCDVCIEEGIALPGMIDAHVHVRDWNLSYKETVESASRAALRGGVVAFFDMPNTSPPINNTEAFLKRVEEFEERSYVDFGIYVKPFENVKDLEKLPIAGVKLFPEDYSRAKDLKEFEGLVVVHPEEPTLIKESPEPGERGFSRSPWAEVEAIERLSYLKRVHFTHVSVPAAIRRARELGKTYDSTPHHLLLNSDKERELGCFAKVNPPLRHEGLRRELFGMFSREPWMIVTDHAPHAVWEKERHFSECPPGFPGLEVALPILLSLIINKVIELRDVAKVYSELPAKLLGLWPKLGTLRNGSFASFTVVNLSKRSLNPMEFESKAKFSPFEGWPVAEVVATVVRGRLAYYRGTFNKPQAINLPGLR